MVVELAAQHPDGAATGLGFQPVLDRVLDQGLQCHRRQRQLLQARRHVNLQVQPRAHADPEDLQVGTGALQLHAQGGHRLVHARQRAAQVLDQVAEHLLGPGRIGAGQHLGVGQGVVEEVRLDLRVQQVQPRHAQFLLGGVLLRGGLLAAALFAHAAGDGTGHRLGILEVAAFIDHQQVHPGTGFGFEQQGDAAGAFARGDHGRDLVALDRQPRDRVPARRRTHVVRVDARHLGADLQTAGRAVDLLDPRQFVDRGLDHLKGLGGIERDLDLPALAAGQAVAVQSPGQQLDPTQVAERTGHRNDQQEDRDQREDRAGAAEDLRPDDRGHDQRHRPGEQDAEQQGQAGGHGRRPGGVGAEHRARPGGCKAPATNRGRRGRTGVRRG